MQSRNKAYSNALLLPVVLAIALGLRLAGIGHGFPFIFHPDEPAVIRTALGIRFFLNPGHFDWPHLYMYINFSLYTAFAVFRNLLELLNLKDAVSLISPLIWNDALVFYYLTRVLTAFIGALTVLPIYLAGRDTFGKRVGILAALAFAVLPFHVWDSHYALIDVPMLFFASWGVFYVLNLLKRNDTNDYAGAGFYIGLAASTKYNGALTFLTVPLAHVVRIFKNGEKLLTRNSIYNLCVAFFTSAIGFLMGTPYAVLDYDTFLRDDGPQGALWQFKNVGSIFFEDRVSEFFREMVLKVSDDLGYTILLGFFIVLGILIFRAIKKRKTEVDMTLWFLVFSGLSFLIYISGFDRSRSQYYFVAYPYIILVFAYLVDLIMQKIGEKRVVLGLFVFLLFFGLPSAMSVRNSFIFTRSDTRVTLYEWIRAYAKPTDLLVYNKNTLSSVIKSFDNPKTKGEPGRNNHTPGYLILAYDDACDCTDFPVSLYETRIKNLVLISNELRLGPKIAIYSFNK